MATTTIDTAPKDERMRQESRYRKLLRRPELGALGGVILVWIIFALLAGTKGFLTLSGTASYLAVAATLGILGVTVSLLMIGGEFDLSIGSVLGASGMITVILSVQYGWNVWLAILVSLVVSLLIGLVNALLVIRTKLPSFIITLGSLFIVRGATIGFTRLITGRTQVGGLINTDTKIIPGLDSAHAVFASVFPIPDPSARVAGVTADFPISILWWLLLAGLATYLLLRTRPGNWIFGMGGDKQAAKNVGVPVERMKIILYMLTAFSAWLVATIQVLTFSGADVLRGTNQEFYTIIAVVVGGTLLTGGYGSAIGAVFGALIYGIVQQGIVYVGIDSDWVQVVLGGMLIIAVLVNNFIRKRAAEA